MQAGDQFIVFRGNIITSPHFLDPQTFSCSEIRRDDRDGEHDITYTTVTTHETDPETFARRWFRLKDTQMVVFIPHDGSSPEAYQPPH